MEVSGQLHGPAALPAGKEPLVHIGYEPEWIPEPIWTRWWREKFPSPAGIRTPDHQARSPTLYHWANPVPCIIYDIILSWTVGVLGFDSRWGLGIFLTTASRTALRPTQPPIQWVEGAPSLEVRRPGREADHSPPSSAEVKNAWSYTSTPQYVFMTWCLVKHRDNFTFTFILYYIILYYNTVLYYSKKQSPFTWLTTTPWRRTGGVEA
jgi:hypothetical protein